MTSDYRNHVGQKKKHVGRILAFLMGLSGVVNPINETLCYVGGPDGMPELIVTCRRIRARDSRSWEGGPSANSCPRLHVLQTTFFECSASEGGPLSVSDCIHYETRVTDVELQAPIPREDLVVECNHRGHDPARIWGVATIRFCCHRRTRRRSQPGVVRHSCERAGLEQRLPAIRMSCERL
jgi:hypothetical protein